MARKRLAQIRVWTGAAVLGWLTLVVSPADGQSSGLLDGSPCTQDADCVSGICSSLFVDADIDGFGAGTPVQRCGGSPPAGFALRGDDCCDLASIVFPGQPQSFIDPVPPQCVNIPPFDYDCDGVDD